MNKDDCTAAMASLPEPAIARLIHLVVELKEEESLKLLREMLDQGFQPLQLLGAFTEGMRRIGILFEQGEYFIAGLIMAGTIMQEATDILTPHLFTGQGQPQLGTMLLGTIRSDIHDLGKDLFGMLLHANGFKVVDIGVDVDPETFASKAAELRPDLVGISCTLTGGLEHLKQAVATLRERLVGNCPPIIIGGVSVDEYSAKFVGADYWVQDAAAGVKLCYQILGKSFPD